MMDIQNEKNQVLNIKLTKLIGLYQILDPGTLKCRGRNVYHIVLAFIVVYMFLISMMFNISGAYYWTDNKLMSVDYFWKAENTLFLIYKMCIIVYHSDDIWDVCMSITRYDFTSFSHRDRHILDRWRERSVWLTTMFTIMYSSTTVFYLGISLAFRNYTLPVKNHDGSIGFYCQNVMNFYFIASDETYNTHYFTFYFAEALFVSLSFMSYVVISTLLITLCFAMCCQMQMIYNAFESVGQKLICDPHSPIGEYHS
ncbi:uncharacterized protein LOC111026810 [Myzus persicae]|uniref:uncharacterized protein LOC111026810 n=1 Tax=Myzus persicae TaxID=13164 RepID=UPI000B936F25|nr:uncharacterized protein LOC111026810 [Myzus persicae]